MKVVLLGATATLGHPIKSEPICGDGVKMSTDLSFVEELCSTRYGARFSLGPAANSCARCFP